MEPRELKGKILYIDDEVESCEMIMKFLDARDFGVIVSFTGESGYDMVKMWEPDLILIDIKLIGMSGIEFIEKIQKEGINTPCIVITGYPERIAEVELKELNIFGYYTKPYSVAELYGKIKEILEVT
ncbi:MAG: response regulator [Candidatus Omnitrophica bacterium]|nr:response regulator [Candidatus Omnitrophota bacterium]